MIMTNLEQIRQDIRSQHLADEYKLLNSLIDDAQLKEHIRLRISRRAERFITDIRQTGTPGLIEAFLAEYGLSNDEGIALMCLAEALLRVPDAETIDELIEDKIAPSSWSKHLGHSSSLLVNASTWGLMLTGSRAVYPARPFFTGTILAFTKLPSVAFGLGPVRTRQSR